MRCTPANLVSSVRAPSGSTSTQWRSFQDGCGLLVHFRLMQQTLLLSWTNFAMLFVSFALHLCLERMVGAVAPSYDTHCRYSYLPPLG